MTTEDTSVRASAPQRPPAARPAPDSPTAGEQSGRRPRPRWRRPVSRLRGTTLLLVVAVLLAAAGAVLLVRAAQLRGSDAATNRAVTDPAATQAVLTEVGRAVETVFSYSYRDPAATERAARGLLGGAAAAEYEQLFGQVTQHAPEQRLTLTTRVAAAGVSTLRGDRATVLVFLDQSYTYGDGRPAKTAAAQLAVAAQRVGGHWQIVNIESR